MTSPKMMSIGIIVGSTRVPRVCPQIAGFVLDTIQAHRRTTAVNSKMTFDTIDLASLNLPQFNEPGIPSQIRPPVTNYVHATTRAWSERVSACDGFIFVSPQYNWGIPGALKNAIDYLYHEWASKPAMIVTYGGHGGDKCASQLQVVLGGGLKMRVVEPTIQLTFGSRDVVVRASKGEDLGFKLLTQEGEIKQGEPIQDREKGLWAERRDDVVTAWQTMVSLLEAEA